MPTSALAAQNERPPLPAISSKALLKLPFFATVETIVSDRGFGFLKIEGSKDEIFFHVTAALSNDQAQFLALKEGDKLLCQIGSTPREPSKSAAVLWTSVTGRDWVRTGTPDSQAGLDRIRRDLFEKIDMEEIGRILQAGWYRRKWKENPPADLEDSVLQEVYATELAALSLGDLSSCLDAAQKCPFAFVAALDPMSDAADLSILLATFAPRQLAAVCAPREEWVQAMGSRGKAGSLTEEHKAFLLDWAALSSPHNPESFRVTWLTGKETYEAIFARRWLASEKSIPRTLLPWLMILLEKELLQIGDLRDLALRDPHAGVLLYHALSDEDQARVQGFWARDPSTIGMALEDDPALGGRLLETTVLAVDLETDGTRIHQMGQADHRGSMRLEGDSLTESLQQGLPDLVSAMTKARLAVGHNAIGWDWPILSRAVPTLPETPVWDTLLVAFLLEPQALSHALGGDHTADADARAALDLFRRQVERFNTSLHEAILTGRCNSTEELFTLIVDAGPGDLSVARATPDVLKTVDREHPLLLPERLLRMLDWIPGYVVTPADPETPLDPGFLEIQAIHLFAGMTAAQRRTPEVEVLMAVLLRAQAQGISVRRNMVPGWLTERLPWLEAALNGATGLPDMEAGCRASPLPASLQWWTQGETWSGQAVLPDDGQRMIVARADASTWVLTKAPIRERTLLLGFADGTGWAVRDPAADRLEMGGSWRSFHTITVPETVTPIKEPHSPQTSRPLLVTRQSTVRDPGSQTQAGYWLEQLATLRSLPAESETVPILLVGSTRSRKMLDLLETALAELGLGEKQPQHRSRREHLKRAAANGYCLVAGLDAWRDWIALAKDVGITLQPVVDAAPLEEWYALEAPAIVEQDEGQDEGPREISTSMVLEGIDKRVEKWLRPWLRETALAESTKVPMLLDPRLEDTRHLTGGAFKWLAVELVPWTAEESQRLDTVFAPLQIVREEAPSGMEAMEHFLVTHWQPSGAAGNNPITGFKPTQLQAMDHIRDCGADVMVTLPTGEGKSVLFQVPALARGLRNRRLTLVISPLRALMRDQIERLHEQGFEESVDFLSGDQSREEQREVLQGVLDQRIVMLYVAPERLRVASFVDVLLRRIQSDGGLEYIVFDEAHCINQWGYEFRPDYFFAFSFLMSQLRTGRFPSPTPVLLLSATLTASDRRRMRGLLERLSQDPDELPLAICPDPSTQVSPLRAHIRVRAHQVKGNIFEQDGKALQERVPELVQVIRTARSNVEKTGQRSAVLVFVLSRSHADILAEQLTRETGQEVESFHAGLDGATREDTYDRFRKGEFNVLVATKAFGMGMDIPDIHWVVHLASPGYLEDYLQEVGRIGRGVREREQAGLDRLDALMLYSAQDFEAIRSMRAENQLQVREIDDIEMRILGIVEAIGNNRIALVPQDGFSAEKYRTPAKRRSDATRLRMALHWLEEAGHLLQAGTVPDLIKIRFSPTRLKRVSEEDSLAGKVATAILEATSNALTVRELALPAMMQRIQLSVGMRTGDDEHTAERKAVINLSRIRRHCRLESLDATMSVITDLTRREALTPDWVIDYRTRQMFSEPLSLVQPLTLQVAEAVRRLLRELQGTGTIRFDPHDWYDPIPFRLVDPDVRDLPKQTREQVELIIRENRFLRSYINGFRTLARVVGIRLKQGLDPESDRLYWQARCSDGEIWIAAQHLDHLLPQAAALMRQFPPNTKEGSLEVTDIITSMEKAHPAGTFHSSDLSSLMRILSSLGFVSTSPNLLPPSYVLQPQGRVPGMGQHPELVEELDSVNRFAETRIFGMEVHANLPEEARDRFVPGYFACSDVDALKGFVDEQLGEIEDETGVFAEKRDQLRATRATEFFDFYRNSPEKAQWEAMQYPYNRHLLVNAGPGAGKTSVLVGRIVHLIREQHVKPSEIMVLAFNRAVVFEIRKRVRDLFRSLGYAAYASRVRVHTFHGLAMRYLGETTPPATEELLPTFARRLKQDAAFRAEVAGECRALLVDEFQDVNDEVYEIIRALHAGSGDRAGIMAIGDDDQDILRWNRKPARAAWGRPAVQAGGVFADHYFGRFRADFGGEHLSELTLGVNFRSSPEIVEKSQEMINGFFGRRTQSQRLKSDRLRAVDGAPSGTVERVDSQGWSWERTLQEVRATSQRLLSENPGSLAVLCRSNDEVASVHRALSGIFSIVTVQSSENIAIRSLRHVALWLDLLEREIAQQDQALTDPLRARLLETFHAETDIPETRAGGRMDPDLSVLWDLCAQETVFPYLSTLVEFLKDLRSDELQRLLGATRPEGEILVSTIHKVKGLEYDNVVVLPSRMSFGGNGTEIEANAAEEARLLYVALTRAKSRLVFHLGDRELAWAGKTIAHFRGAQDGGRILTGTPKEVFISWSMNRSNSNADPECTQVYIETSVSVGDSISIGTPGHRAGMALIHGSGTGERRQIGSPSKAVGHGGDVTDLKVSAVIRYELKPDDRAQPCPKVAAQGWGYVVLVEGVLR